jgi:aminoglycoside phosphotransferase (APT) family kinase protein
VEQLRHGYTNVTVRDGDRVVKRYVGPDAAHRRAVELAVLQAGSAELPLPPLFASGPDRIVTGFVAGRHGQDLIDAGQAGDVLRGCGEVLARIHAMDVAAIWADAREGSVLVHGDFGPNNVLFDPQSYAVVAVLDWEWAHPGDPIDDLAWCEWIVRMHHPDSVDHLDRFYVGYGATPAWQWRQQAMVRRCEQLHDFSDRLEPGGPAARQWAQRLELTAAWRE